MKAQGLPMSTIVLIIMVLLVLVLVVLFFYGGVSKGQTQSDTQSRVSECQTYCLRAQSMASSIKSPTAAVCGTSICAYSGYCTDKRNCNLFTFCTVTYSDGGKHRLVCSGGGADAVATCGDCVAG